MWSQPQSGFWGFGIFGRGARVGGVVTHVCRNCASCVSFQHNCVNRENNDLVGRVKGGETTG